MSQPVNIDASKFLQAQINILEEMLNDANRALVQARAVGTALHQQVVELESQLAGRPNEQAE